jgi:hypothetical protein
MFGDSSPSKTTKYGISEYPWLFLLKSTVIDYYPVTLNLIITWFAMISITSHFDSPWPPQLIAYIPSPMTSPCVDDTMPLVVSILGESKWLITLGRKSRIRC